MNVKPGDLAIVVRDIFSENLSLIVKVDAATPCKCGAASWVCTSEGRPVVIQKIGLIGAGPLMLFKAQRAIFHDRDLRPISGLPDPFEITNERPVDLVA